ncbi:SCP2 sterol-binding domain-containing protein [Ectothiorhodospiraceae bacterium WFHF3C12]|nr:SCP2 sterol-binding domain-containing protein [Ectothiorhodospiraceae bacterium WFHF3C12]
MTSSERPLLPGPWSVFAGALHHIDRKLVEPAAMGALNAALGTYLADGGLDGLEGRVIRVSLLGTPWSLDLGLQAGRLERVTSRPAETELTVGPADALRLICRTEDPDTLFFQRRLRIEGDVELGLYVKNALDAVDEAMLPGWAARLIGLARSTLIGDH